LDVFSAFLAQDKKFTFMVTTAFFYLFYANMFLLTAPLRLFNNSALPQGLSDSIVVLKPYFVTMNEISPVDFMIVLLGISLFFEGAYFTYKIAYWVIKKIPTIS